MASPFWKTLSLGTLAGLRSMTPLAALSSSFAKHRSDALGASPLRLLQSGVAAKGLTVLAASEMVADKLPGMPDRITPTALLGRGLSGAIMGAMLYKSKRRSGFGGGLLGHCLPWRALMVAFTYAKNWASKLRCPTPCGPW
ncbi:DUF4126 family protein [Hymenobacter cellulosilyticus]|uniref:DUF4126 family protein n=1 Tax=Hymenobacter cellulosilyticus TaxID=2932248 RepID=A0A8T9Q4K5_9BACT|nr:DUF4126 family protein [Hymenobacter cellulosilyticus]UOQ71902.1 DUF4126 family protein [Hymenobacter cellulosilyticus]